MFEYTQETDETKPTMPLQWESFQQWEFARYHHTDWVEQQSNKWKNDYVVCLTSQKHKKKIGKYASQRDTSVQKTEFTRSIVVTRDRNSADPFFALAEDKQ